MPGSGGKHRAAPLQSSTPTTSTTPASASTAATSATSATTTTAATTPASTAATSTPTPATTSTATPTPSAASTTTATAPPGPTRSLAPLAPARAASPARGRRHTDRLKTNELKKVLYGLKQAPRQWYLKLREVLEEIGFTPSTADHSLFMLGEEEKRSFMVVCVDDILIFSPSSALVMDVMLKLQDKFKSKALGDVNFYLGLHIERDVERWCMRVHQRKYLEA
ncbi:unnamed protein product [Closterium sp. NIES-54]